MRRGFLSSSFLATVCAGALAFATLPSALAQDAATQSIKLGSADIGGVVTSANGREAGVWVIAETTDLPTKYAKIVVTDDQGRYLIPDLPKATYQIWVRGYGLVDSKKVASAPGETVNLAAVVAPSPAAAAQYYPAIYWYSMLKVPDKKEFASGAIKSVTGMPIHSQGQWLDTIKTDGCYTCHQLGSIGTRYLSSKLGTFKTLADAWSRRIQSGQASALMVSAISRLDQQRAFQLFGDWTDRIAEGGLPSSKPVRPQGIERNIVLTLWDWATPTSYLHDEVSTDKRDPRLNPYGKIYGSPEESSDYIPVLDPKTNTASFVKSAWRDPKTPTTKDNPILAPSVYWGDKPIWDSHTVIHNPMFDEKGRVWFTTRIRGAKDPAWCGATSDLPSAKLFPLETSGRQLGVYDPATQKFTPIDLCFPTHHLQFDKNGVLWFSSGNPAPGVIGWFNTKIWDQTHDEQKAQGWTAIVLDTNGDGKRSLYTEPGKPLDPKKDKRIVAGLYGVSVSPLDGSVWGSVLGFPGGIVRMVPGDNPPATAISEYYEVPWNDPRAPINGFSPRGFDIDGNGVAWVPLASGHIASFDRRKCKEPLNGPLAIGNHCPEGWTLYPLPGPQLSNVTDNGSAEAPYFTWVDVHDTSGLGANTPFATGNGNESLIALVNGKMVNMRVPYPLGFFAKDVDGRIDDPNAGWKGRGLWSTSGNRTPFHGEGGKSATAKVIHFQIRPNPLAD